MINTPSITATKWWPGELSVCATHAVLCAKLIIDGDDYGVQFFVIQIRKPQTHEVVEGIEVGDMGTKLGFNSKDNGFIRFKDYRIPRENLVSFIFLRVYYCFTNFFYSI